VGAEVEAHGLPLGLPLTFTRGTVSATNRSVSLKDHVQTGMVQTDTPLNHGNSGVR